MLLYQDPKKDGNANDPILINPKGVEVQVPEQMVPDLLKKGFKIRDRDWSPTIEEPEIVNRSVPKDLLELQKELQLKIDILEVTEI